jgi:tetratricopeptide (TPR) repeat protein
MAIDCFNRALVLLNDDKFELIALCHCLKGKIYLDGLKQTEKAIEAFKECKKVVEKKSVQEEAKNDLFLENESYKTAEKYL